jgi:foldase protein PrsA
MKRHVAFWIAIGVSVAAGIVCGQVATRSIPVRDQLGTICGRGHLLALVYDRGVYQVDVDRGLREFDYLRDIERRDAAEIERRTAANNLIANIAAERRASGDRIPHARIKHEVALLRSQFPSTKTWLQSLNASGFSNWSLWWMVRSDLRARDWILKQTTSELEVTEAECRAFYESHIPDFFFPERIHASHLFLAAPPKTAPETAQAKQSAIEAFSVRLASGEDFAALVAENSEDEATKLRGGDLGWFTAVRMPPDFVAAAMKLQPGGISGPIRTRLGFHIIKLVEMQPARERSFDEMRGDIAIGLANQKRAAAVRKLLPDLDAQATYLRPL